jgi:hypothetical protein
MSNFYIDFVNGNDANDGLGPYKAAFTSGGTAEIAVGDTVAGATSGKVAKVVHIVISSGTWASGSAAGTLYVGTPDGAFTDGENLNVSGKQDNIATLTADFVVSSWLTVNSGPTSARIAPGDNIRLKKNTDPESVGSSMAFTNGSANATMSTAVTQMICNCSSAWTASANVTPSNPTGLVSGSCQQFVFASGFSTGKVGYFSFATVDLSAFQMISLVCSSNADIAASMFSIKLCSDAAGDTPVDTMIINSGVNYDNVLGATGHRIRLDNGGALGSAIRSIALYAESDPGTITFKIDDIIATNGLCHHSLIGRNDGYWYPVLAINNTVVTLAQVYRGDSDVSPVSLYHISDFISSSPVAYNTIMNQANDYGTFGSLITYQGGWNFTTNDQDGYTNLHSRSGMGIVWYSQIAKHYNRLENIRMRGGYYGLFAEQTSNASQYWELKNIETYYVSSNGIYCNVTKVEGEIRSIACGNGSVWGSVYLLGTGSYNRILISANIYIELNSTYTSGALLILTGGTSSYHVTGNVDLRAASSNNLLALRCGTIFMKEVSFTGNILFGANQVCYGYIAKIIVNCTSYLYLFMDSAQGSSGLGMLQVGRAIINGGASFYVNTAGLINYSGMPIGSRFSVDSINDVAGRFLCFTSNGFYLDHVTFGYAADWGYGGTGYSLVLATKSTVNYLQMDMYIPVAASKTYKVTFQNKKSSAAATCTLVFDVDGCGITRIAEESVSLTDSWAKHSSADVTTTIAGFLRVCFKALDGATSGRIGLDEIKVEEQV